MHLAQPIKFKNYEDISIQANPMNKNFQYRLSINKIYERKIRDERN